MEEYSVKLRVQPLGVLYVIDDRTTGGYKPHIKEFIVCHYILLADHTLAVNEYGHRVNLLILGKRAFVKREDAENKLKEIIKLIDFIK